MSVIEASPPTAAFEEQYAQKGGGPVVDQKRWRWFWLALAVMSIPMMVPYLLAMWDQEHYQYFPFVFVVIGFLAFQRSDRELYSPRGLLGWGLIGVGLTFLGSAVALPSAWMAGLAFVVLATACLHSLRSEGSGRSLIGLAVPLIMLVQLPIGLDNMLINRLQRLTTQLSSVALDIWAVPHSVSGNILQLKDRELFVAEACSGIQSVFTLAFLACVLVAWRRRRVWLTPLYLLIGVLLAVAGNTLRVTSVAMAQHFFETDLASGIQHDILGYITLAISGLFLLSFDHLVQTVLHPVSLGGREAADNILVRVYNFFVSDVRFETDDNVYGNYGRTTASSTGTASIKVDWMDRLVMNKFGWAVTLGLIGIAFVGSLVQSMRVEVNRAPQVLLRSVVLFEPEPKLLNDGFETIQIRGHQVTRNGSEPRLGQNADLWDFTVDNLVGQIVISQTYSGWHELCVCYQNMDWELLDRDVTEPIEILQGDPSMDGDENRQSFVTARFRREDKSYGYLFFTAVNADGTVPDAPSTYGAFGSRFLSRLERYGAIEQQNLVMLQMWIVVPDKLERDTLNGLQKDFVRVRTRVSDVLLDLPTGAVPSTTQIEIDTLIPSIVHHSPPSK